VFRDALRGNHENTCLWKLPAKGLRATDKHGTWMNLPFL